MSKKIDKTLNSPPGNIERITRHSNGSAESKSAYMNDTKHGMETLTYEDGLKWHESTWEYGRQNGLATHWYKSGAKQYAEMRKDGKLHGLSTWWHENSQKQGEIYHLRGEPYSWISWDEEGNVIKKELLSLLISQALKKPKNPNNPSK